MTELERQIARRRTFAIISHPDAGKTTLTEKLLLFGGAIQLAGSVKSRKAARHATSDWMAMERERGISVTSSVMQFDYHGHIVNLLDTPGHADFSEDTYRVLSAVDSALMVIDAARGVEERTIKLMDVCRMRDTPIFTFINKLDREIRDPMELLDEIEKVLGIECAPVTWPIGAGKRFKGIYQLLENAVYLYRADKKDRRGEHSRIESLDEAQTILGDAIDELRDEIELVQGASHAFDPERYRAAQQTPVFFGSALNNFGVTTLLDEFVKHAPAPLPRMATTRVVEPNEKQCTAFVFKIQANMDPKHRDRVAFARICSGAFEPGMKLHHVRTAKDIKINAALSFLADSREQVQKAWPGDIIGIHNHGTVSIGDTFTEGESLHFTGVPNFAPELFKRARLKDPLRLKQLQKGLDQLCEEGATQFFRPEISNDLILGAIGSLQFDLVAYRLKSEYQVECIFEPIPVITARWVASEDRKSFEEFRARNSQYLAIDHFGDPVYLAPSRVNLQLTEERWPAVRFSDTREHASAIGG